MFDIMDNDTFMALLIFLTYTLGNIAVWAVKPLKQQDPAEDLRP